ncbi:RNA polymerase sigma factor [Pseudactinotalea sp.]|uniref:RNA polymerase sigma factor n=1 Tax=Pseudactinotalea sp. TaxID=1926260 RepID=UPI003B3AB8CB
MKVEAADAVEQAWRQDWGRLLGLLVGRFRDVDLAEDALADAFEAATRTWPADGVPANPAAWLLTAARRRALDRLRGTETARRKLPLLVVDHLRQEERESEEEVEVDDVGDDELKLLFLACHPALAPESQAALALRLVLGVPTAEIARLFLVAEPTMAARITRAKKKIATAGVPFVMPDGDALAGRVDVATQAIYLCFTAGYAPGFGEAVVRADLAGEAIRLARVLAALLERRGEPAPVVLALLALMVLQHSRRDARVEPDGALVLLADQDRGRWHHDEIAEGLALLATLPPESGRAEELRLQAVIAARHATAVHPDGTDWPAIAADYLRLERLTGSPVVRLNRAVAVAEADGPRAGLALLDGLDDLLPLSHRLPAVRGELLARAGEVEAAREAFVLAIERCGNDAEVAYLRATLASL